MHLRKRDYGVLESGAILILTAVDWMSTEKRACIDWSGYFPGGWQSGSYPETGCEEFVPHSDILESWIVHSILAP